MRLVDRIDAKHGTFEIGQRANLVLHNLYVLGGYVNQHHQRKIARPETTRYGRAHVPTRVDDNTRHVRHNAQTIQTSRVNDQRFGGIAIGCKGLRGDSKRVSNVRTLLSRCFSKQNTAQHQLAPQYNPLLHRASLNGAAQRRSYPSSSCSDRRRGTSSEQHHRRGSTKCLVCRLVEVLNVLFVFDARVLIKQSHSSVTRLTSDAQTNPYYASRESTNLEAPGKVLCTQRTRLVEETS
jgi:hypothetical protein